MARPTPIRSAPLCSGIRQATTQSSRVLPPSWVSTAAQPDRHRAGLFRFPALCLQYLPVKPGPVTAETAAVLARLSWAKILMSSLCTASASEVCPGCILPQAKADFRRSSAPVPGR